jgi:hypothetical protein
VTAPCALYHRRKLDKRVMRVPCVSRKGSRGGYLIQNILPKGGVGAARPTPFWSTPSACPWERMLWSQKREAARCASTRVLKLVILGTNSTLYSLTRYCAVLRVVRIS